MYGKLLLSVCEYIILLFIFGHLRVFDLAFYGLLTAWDSGLSIYKKKKKKNKKKKKKKLTITENKLNCIEVLL